MSDLKRWQSVWAVSDGRAGNVRQAEALAAALAPATFEPVSLTPRAPWQWFAPRALARAKSAFGRTFGHRLDAPAELVIGCGRQAALATRLLRARGSRAVQILDPRIGARHWDLVIVPEHDRLRGDNVLTLLGSLNPIDDAWLAQARADFTALAELPSPRVVLLVGGPTTHADWQPQQLGQLCVQLAAQVQAAGGSLLVTASRRTPALAILALRHGLRQVPSLLWRNEDDGANPYRGLLGWADAIVATTDSVNLLSEACATRAPVAVAFAETAKGRVQRFVQALQARGRLCEIDALLPPAGDLVPLRETERIAEQIRQRLGTPA